MSCLGELEPLDAVVFADTAGEAPATYTYLDVLRGQAERAGIRFLTVSAGDLRGDLMARTGRGGQATPPVRVRHADGRLGRINRYHCSYTYKRLPIARAVKALCGPPGAWKHTAIEQWIGYSAEEVTRVKPADECRCGHKRLRRATGRLPFEQIHTPQGCARCTCGGFDPWQVNRWPLIELGMTRADCQQWIRAHGFPVPPRSACYFCANRPAAYWPRLKRDQPALFERAVELDEALRHGINGLRGQAYLHQAGIPLASLPDTGTARDTDGGPGDPDADPDRDPGGDAAMDCEAGMCFT